AGLDKQDVHGGINIGTGLPANNLINVAQMVVVGAYGAADHAIGLAKMDHHGTNEREAAPHLDPGHFAGHAPPTHDFPIGRPVTIEALVVLGICDFDVDTQLDAQSKPLDAIGQYRRTSDQNRVGQAFVNHDLSRTQHPFVFTLGKYNARLATVAQ